MQQSASPHVTKLVDLILIEVFLLAEILQKGNRYCHVMSCHVMSCHVMSCHVTYIELVHGHGHDLGGVSPQPQLPSLLLVPGT